MIEEQKESPARKEARKQAENERRILYLIQEGDSDGYEGTEELR